MTISLKPSPTTAALVEDVRRWSLESVRAYAREADTVEGYPDIPEVIKSCPLDLAPVGFATLKDDEFVDRAHTLKTDIEFGPNVLSVFITEPLSEGDSWAWQMLQGGTLSEDLIELIGTPEQIERWCTGEHVLTAVAMTEEQSGTDLAGIQTTAVRDGDDWILNGKKVFISNVLEAEWIVLLATIDPSAGSRGVRAFILDKDDIAKFDIETDKEDKIGFRFIRNATFELHDIRLPADRCIGGENASGVGAAMMVFSKNRATCATWGTSIARGCLRYTEDWVAEKSEEFSQERLAKIRRDFLEMHESLDDVVRLALKSAWIKDRGESSVSSAAQAKAVAPKLSESVVLRCLQLMGAEGATRQHLMEKWFRDVKMTDAMLGPSQVQRRTVAQMTIGGGAK